MKKIFYIIPLMLIVLYFSGNSYAQVKLQEGFETTDTITGVVPPGWSLWDNTPFPIEPAYNWMVRDSARYMPGLATDLSKSRLSKRAMGITWWAGIDTNTSSSGIADAWLVTKRLNISAADSLRFFASGGSASYLDSMQVWVSIIDSLPQTFILFSNYKLGTISFPRGSVYGQFIRKAYSLNIVAGQTAWIGFRYFTNTTVDGYAVYLDDVFVGNPLVSIHSDPTVPSKFALMQNYPNPFNPVTNVKFDLPKATNVQMIIYNSMGQEVKSLVNEFKQAGSYSVDFNASNLSSGIYFYKLITSDFVETKKMTLVK